VITLTYQYKLKPTKRQIMEIDHYLDVCKNVFNYALKERKDWLNSRKSLADRCSLSKEYIIPVDTPYPSYNHQAKALTQAKKNNERLKSVNAQVLQQTLKQLDRAFSDIKAKGFGFPRFKKKMRSFVFPAMLKNCLGDNKVKLPKFGWVKIRQSRPYPTGFEPKQTRIVKKASGYYLMIIFQSEEIIPEHSVGKRSIGLDAGIESFIATSQNELIKAPKFLRDNLRKLKLLQRRLKNKIKGSNSWLRIQNRIAKLHEKIADTRKDWHFKLAHKICDLTDNIFVEDINFKSWSRGIIRKVSLDSGIGQFINEILPFVCGQRGKFYLKVDKDYTSQECPKCGSLTGKKKLSERIHKCDTCGYNAHRDVAAAEVIENRGKVAVGHTVQEKASGVGLAGCNCESSCTSSEAVILESPALTDARRLAVGVSRVFSR
jgi:putative transposase